MATKQLSPRATRYVSWVGFSFIVGAGVTLTVIGPGLAERLGGSTLVVSCFVFWVTLRGPRTDTGTIRRTDEGIRLPPRLAYPALLSLGLLLLSIAMLCMGAAAINDPDYSGGYRGSAEVLVVLFPPLFVLAVLNAGAGLIGRGRLTLTADDLRFVPLVGRTKICTWERITLLRGIPRDALLVTAPRMRIVVADSSQLFTPATMAALVEQFRDTDRAGREALLAAYV